MFPSEVKRKSFELAGQTLGELKGDVKDGEIKTERKDNWTDVTVKADGRTMKAHVPNTSIFPSSNRDKDQKRYPGSQSRCQARAHDQRILQLSVAQH